MKLTPEVINSISFEEFANINCILSNTLGEMSRKTSEQRKKIHHQE